MGRGAAAWAAMILWGRLVRQFEPESSLELCAAIDLACLCRDKGSTNDPRALLEPPHCRRSPRRRVEACGLTKAAKIAADEGGRSAKPQWNAGRASD